MSTLNPPVELDDPSLKFRVNYIQEVASQPDFNYPPVSLYFPDHLLCIHLYVYSYEV